MGSVNGWDDRAFEREETRWDAEDERRNYPMPHKPKPIPQPHVIDLGYIVMETRQPGLYRVITPKRVIYMVNVSPPPTCDCADFFRHGMERPCKHINLIYERNKTIREIEERKVTK